MNEEEFVKLTKLARLSCTPEEKSSLLASITSILAYTEELAELDTENAPPCHTVLEHLSNIMRDDVPGPLLSKEAFLANAPASTGGMIRVPPILAEEADA